MAGANGSSNAPHPRHLILGTAGHVDHGKTELVRALTGCDTDRLKEEKERGISIELGFAPLPLDDNTFIGIVDVPGHERFVRQMVSGAGGIDMAMLLVAADEGVMPQTQEHMEVLASLRLDTGLVVISKSDLGGEDIMPLLEEDIAELTRGTFLEDAPIVATSAKTGAGLDALRGALLQLADKIEGRDTSGPFRLAADRVFHQQGIGVVVTGSCYSGTVKVGDSMELLPGGQRVRLRELQSFGAKRDQGSAGERLAMALQGVKLDDVRRGDMVVSPGAFVATSVVDVRIRLAHYQKFELRNRERIRVHHGAREVLGRIILLETDTLRWGEDTLAQLRLESAIVPDAGDALVIRKYSPMRVVGGAVVIDPSPEKHKRFHADAIERIELREQGDPVSVLQKTLDRAGLDGAAYKSVDREAVEQLLGNTTAVRVGNRVFSASALGALASQIESLAKSFISRHPLQWGIDKEELRERVKFPHPPQLFNGVLEEIARSHDVFVRENRVRSGSETLELPAETRRHIDSLGNELRKRGVTFASRGEIESAWKGNERFADAVQLLKDSGDIVEMGDAGLMHREAVDTALSALGEIFARGDELSVGDVKDALGLTRKHAIPLLEYFDEKKITVRSGSARRRGPAFPGA